MMITSLLAFRSGEDGAEDGEDPVDDPRELGGGKASAGGLAGDSPRRHECECLRHGVLVTRLTRVLCVSWRGLLAEGRFPLVDCA